MENMKAIPQTCAHEWTYLVTVKTGAIGMRRCTKCGEKATLTSTNPVAERESLKLPA